ncbi:MAG: sugar O-acetyltransferase [Bacteroidaceae bacterium]|nr:sugar O-acetyltransferase [Bacteroidaceae bacterium]
MTEKEKCARGLLYDANSDSELIRERLHCQDECFRFNNLRPSEVAAKAEIITRLLGRVGDGATIVAPFHCDYGYNIEVGTNFFANFNLVILDAAKVSFGDDVFVGPNCSFYTAVHPLDAERRNQGLECARPITVGNNVWFGGNVVVLPGVTVGDNSVVGAGSVVTKDVPAFSVVAGNPARVIRTLN